MLATPPAPPCPVHVVGTRVVAASGKTVYREPVRRSSGAEVKCSGRTVWVLFHNGVAASQEAYVGVRSGDGGRTWKLLLAEGYFGVKAPFAVDSYSGPWALVGERAAFFVGSCPACGRWTVSLTVTLDDGRSFHHYRVPLLTGWGAVLRSVRFTDLLHGQITAGDSSRRRTVVTSDGGRSWELGATS